MSTRVPKPTHDIATAMLALIIGLGALYALTGMSYTWVSARSWEPVSGELLRAEMRSVRPRGQGRTPTVIYSYVHDGVNRQGDDLSHGWFPQVTRKHQAETLKNLSAGQTIIVWVNPRRPQQSVLFREFDWQAALCWFLLTQLGFFIMWGYFKGDPEPSHGAMIPPVPESRMGMLMILLGNLTIMPLALISLIEMRLWPILIFFPMAILGLCLLSVKCHSLRRRWQVGMPLFADASDGSGLTTARFIFSPRYGQRLAGVAISAYASVEYRQLLYRSVNNQEKIETVQTGTMGPMRLKFGQRSVDFKVRLPGWPTGHDVRPAMWEMDFKVAGTTFTYRLPPGFGR